MKPGHNDVARLIAFGWYGGKFGHLAWLPLLPMTTHYCEPVAGSAAALINHMPAPVETYNGRDADHRRLAEVLHGIQGKAAISGYHGPLLDALYRDWQLHRGPRPDDSLGQAAACRGIV